MTTIPDPDGARSRAPNREPDWTEEYVAYSERRDSGRRRLVTRHLGFGRAVDEWEPIYEYPTYRLSLWNLPDGRQWGQRDIVRWSS